MIEEVFHIGSFSVSPFGVLLVLAFWAAYLQLRSGFKVARAGEEDDASALLFAGGLGGIAGAKIYFAILYRDWHVLFDRAGLVWYGGFLLGAACVIFVMVRRRLPIWPTLDAATPALALGYAIGRIGCFLVGDDYGVPTDAPWGVKFKVGPSPSTADTLHSQFGVPVPAGVSGDTVLAVHPTQLYETALALMIWGIGWKLLRRQRASGTPSGTTAIVVLSLLACERFAVEFLRAKDDRLFGGFTLAQVISAAVLIALVGLGFARRRGAAAGAEAS
ncbi:MAG: prolipoprotein diacylglyceryl transferase family protein [Acidobacteriota bacterium]